MKEPKFDLDAIGWVARSVSPARFDTTPVIGRCSETVLNLDEMTWGSEVQDSVLKALDEMHLVAPAPNSLLEAVQKTVARVRANSPAQSPFSIVLELPDSEYDRLKRTAEGRPGTTIGIAKQDTIRMKDRPSTTLDPVKQIRNPKEQNFAVGSVSTIHLVPTSKVFNR